jgi:hypothetical protein
MMKRGRHNIKSHMTLEFAFVGIRVQGGVLTPVEWHLTADLVATEKKGRTKADVEYKASIAYQRLYFWLETNLPNILVVDVSNEDDLYLANLSANIAMYCPDNPGDDILIQLLHAKLSSLADNELVVGEMHLKGSDTSLKYTFDCPDADYTLPAATADYYPEAITRDEIPWWMRNDGFCFEFVKPEDSELTTEEFFKDIFDPMDEFERIMTDAIETRIGVVKEPASIVKVEKWQPKKVE